MSHSPKTVRETDDYQAGWDATMRLVRQGRSWSGHERNCAFLNLGLPRFANVSALSGVDFDDDGRGVALVDWDHDGDLDLWLRNRTAPRLRLMLNRLDTASRADDFVALRLQGTTANRDGIGARVELHLGGGAADRSVQTLRAGEGFRSQSSKWLHFGLGRRSDIEGVTVRWPGGRAERFTGVRAGGRYLLVEGAGQAREWIQSARPLALPTAPQRPARPSQAGRVVLSRRVPAPLLRHTTFDDAAPRAVSHDGRPLLLNLWASWCRPCVEELQALTARRDDLRAAGVDVLALTVEGVDEDDATEPAHARRQLQQIGFPFDAGVATVEMLDKLELLQEALFGRVPPFAVPLSFLFDADGRLAVIYRGPVVVDRLVADLALPGVGRELRQAALPFHGRWYGAEEPAESHLGAVAERFRERYPEDAVRLLEAALSGAPAEMAAEARAELHFRLAELLAGQERPREAVEHYRRSLGLAPDRAEAYNGLGTVLSRAGALDDAERFFRRALELDPSSAKAHNNLGLSSYLRGHLDAAVRHYRESLRLDPAFGEARYNLGLALLTAGESAAALEQFRAALELDPDSLGPLTETAWILATAPDPRLRDGAEAIRLSLRAAELTENRDATILDTLAAAYAEDRRFDLAVETATVALGRATAEQNGELAGHIRRRLELYRQQRPHREPAP